VVFGPNSEKKFVAPSGGGQYVSLQRGDCEDRQHGARSGRGVAAVLGECLPLAGTLPLLPVAAALGELCAVPNPRMV
jgi:hypothetical protein